MNCDQKHKIKNEHSKRYIKLKKILFTYFKQDNVQQNIPPKFYKWVGQKAGTVNSNDAASLRNISLSEAHNFF